MSSVTENPARIAALTSSEAYKVMTNGKGLLGMGAPGMTYLEEKKMEKRLGRSIKLDAYSKAIAWGTILQHRVNGLLTDLWESVEQDTVKHPTIEGWAGSVDLIIPKKKVGEIKCYEPKNFCTYVDALLTKDVTVLKSECPAEYWQIVSNACIHKVDTGVGICYMPYKSELADIRRYVNDDFDEPGEEWKYRFIVESPDYALAHLPDGGFYKNLNVFEFKIPGEDKEALTARAKEFIKLINAK
jgi:hypothetical protein